MRQVQSILRFFTLAIWNRHTTPGLIWALALFLQFSFLDSWLKHIHPLVLIRIYEGTLKISGVLSLCSPCSSIVLPWNFYTLSFVFSACALPRFFIFMKCPRKFLQLVYQVISDLASFVFFMSGITLLSGFKCH